MTVIDSLQYQETMRAEQRHPVSRLTSNSKRALEFFLQERESALRMIVHNDLIGAECTQDRLEEILKALRKSLSFVAFVDLGVIDASGAQKCYAGPYDLLGKNYSMQDWFHRVSRQGIYISDVFLGYRKSPHFAIAIRFEGSGGRDTILRATIDSEQLHRQLMPKDLRPDTDIFIINREGALQSPSRRYGSVLERLPLPVPVRTGHTEVIELEDEGGEAVLVGYAYIKDSPFILMLVKPATSLAGGWAHPQVQLFGFLLISCVLVIAVCLAMSRKLVRSLRESDKARSQVFYKMEYTNKLATVGRLAAGVAHEINNPLAIINQRAGLLHDRISMITGFPGKEKATQAIDSVLKSVDRCSAITHRLLGFAKQIVAHREAIHLEELLREVVGFLEKEIGYRGVTMEWDVQDGLPQIKSDRGQLQQVFLNLVNNALAAVGDDGRIRITARMVHEGSVAVAIEDNGTGIPKENLRRIFEPFFTTKPGVGTGLGLSVTYGIVNKLGGEIRVDSQVGKGTVFTVVLPTEAKEEPEKPSGISE